ncbi:MAG: LysR family transcriptional regulator [Deltaproteobacteria bacterium]|nr:LysR family transcriptional regulator [Deltaproteobacteria bacterium]
MISPRDLPLLASFAAVARRGTFTAAARDLGLAKSVVSDQVRALEERCGARLMERSTRRLRLTQVGEQVLGVAASIEHATRDLDALLEEHRRAPVGTLRIATIHDLGARFVTPVAARLALQHPQLRLDIVADDSPHDLIAEGFDVAIRLGMAADSDLVMRRLGVMVEHVVASPAVADRYAAVHRPRELAGAPWVRHAVASSGETFRFQGPRGEVDEVVVSVRATANSSEGMRGLLRAGVGLACLPDDLVDDELRRGALVKLCPEWVWQRVTLYALLPSARRQPRRVELFLAALKEALATAGVAREAR